jgi:large subunit ribosomal protein L27e
VSTDVLEKGAESKKEEALKSVKKIFEERFKTGKNRWFFTKLRF